MSHDPSELLLLEKANFVLQSIHLAAVVFTSQQLILTLPIILVKSYEGLFEEKVPGINYSPSNKFDHACNCEIILRNLYDKFKLQIFQELSGNMIVDGHLPAVYHIVDFLFEVAKRIVQRRHHQKFVDSVCNQEVAEKEPSPDLNPTRPSDQALQEFYSLKKQLKCKDDINAVLKRIANIRMQNADAKDGKPQALKKSQGGKQTHKQQHLAPSKLVECREEGDCVPGGCVQESNSPRALAKSNAQPELGARKRPQTAPTRPSPRYKQQTQQQSPTQQTQSHSAVKASKSPPKRPSGPTIYDRSLGRCVEVSELRRMERERWMKLAQRFQFDDEACLNEEQSYSDDEDQVKNGADDDAAVSSIKKSPHRGHSDGPISPLRPPQGSPSVSGRNASSVDTYVQKMRSLRQGSPPSPGLKQSPKHFDTPRQLPCYAHMRPLDIVLSVEHCVNCESHKKTVRHDPKEYQKRAGDILRQLVMAVHMYSPCCRVGVVCEEANVEATGDHFRCGGVDNSQCSGCGSESRLGAFEVQVAFKQAPDHRGESLMLTELLHSKLGTRLWPSKKAVSKQLESFLTKAGIKSYRNISLGDRRGFICEAQMPSYQADSSYPVGMVDWTDVAHSTDSWEYLYTSGNSNRVCWSFDASPLYWVGESVIVKHTSLPLAQRLPGGAEQPEKYSFLGRVVWAQSDDTLIVRPRYIDSEVPCLIENCTLCATNEDRRDSCRAPYEYVTSRSRLPLPLHAVLNFAIDENLCNWTVMCPSDKSSKSGMESEVDFLLCRSSFYRQIRDLVWLAMANRPGDSVGNIADYSSHDFSDIDAQLAYSDIVLDWVFREVEDTAAKSESGELGLVSMKQLVQWARSGFEYYHNVISEPVCEVADVYSGGQSCVRVNRVSIGGPVTTSPEEKQVNIVVYVEISHKDSPQIPTSVILEISGVKYQSGKIVSRKVVPMRNDDNDGGSVSNTVQYDCIFGVKGEDPLSIFRGGKMALALIVSEQVNDDEKRSVHLSLMA